jgi:hypothetical protein
MDRTLFEFCLTSDGEVYAKSKKFLPSQTLILNVPESTNFSIDHPIVKTIKVNDVPISDIINYIHSKITEDSLKMIKYSSLKVIILLMHELSSKNSYWKCYINALPKE